MKTIRLDYAKVTQEVSRLKNAANACQNLANESKKEFADLHNYWEGAAASVFMAAYTRWQKDILAIGKELNTLYVLIQRVADEIREAENRAASIIGKGGGSGGGGGGRF